MFDSLFNLPLVIVGAAILILLCAFALGGLAIFSHHILPRLKLGPEESVFTSRHDAGDDGFLWTGCGLDCGERLADSHGCRGNYFRRSQRAGGPVPARGRLPRAAALPATARPA